MDHAPCRGRNGRHGQAVHRARRRGRHHRGRGQLLLQGLCGKGQGGQERGQEVARCWRVRRRLGLRCGLLHHDRGRCRRLRVRRACLPDPRSGERLRFSRGRGSRALRQDGPQRRRVRDAPGLRRGVRDPPEVPVRLRSARHLEPVEPGERGTELAPRARRAGLREGRQSGERPGLRRGLGRGPLDGSGGHRGERAGERHRRLALRAVRLAPGRFLRHEGHRGAARRVRRARDQRGEHRAREVGGWPVAETQVLQNVLRDDHRLPRVPEPAIMVIFGASGDLTARKLVPALYDLASQRRLPMEFAVVGISRTPLSHEEFRERLHDALKEQRPGRVSDDVWESFSSSLFYLPGDSKKPETYEQLQGFLKELDKERGTDGNRIFYLASSLSLVPTIVERLGEAGMSEEGGGYARLVVEKPFGRDLESARELNREIRRYFEETQIYRIDHYLGKDTVQNVLALRFANGIFEPIWNQHYVDHVQITVAEDIGVGTRGAFYEEAGALRDIVQNHVMQILCLTAMEPPVTFDAESVREEKVKVLKAVRPIPEDEVDLFAVRSQYARGWIFGEEVPGYREERDVAPDSSTETYVALKVFVDNWRWAGVPFYIRAGKRLPKKATEIAIQFHPTPHTPFARDETLGLEPNVLVVRVQPQEGISLKIGAKVPGTGFEISSVNMDLLYGTAFLEEAPDAYQRLLLDLMLGDPTLFIRADEAEDAWAILEPVMRAWSGSKEVPTYPAGTWGPEEAEELLERDGREWRRP